MPEFFITFAEKYFSRFFFFGGGGHVPPPPVFFTYATCSAPWISEWNILDDGDVLYGEWIIQVDVEL